MLAGYQEFALGFEPRDWELPQFFFWKILTKKILFFQLVVYPGKMLQIIITVLTINCGERKK